MAEAFAARDELVEFTKGDKIITQGGEDNDIYLLLAGSRMVKKLIGHLISCRLALIVFQQSTQPLPIPYLSRFPIHRLIPQRKKKQVVFALMISFFMIMSLVMV